MQNPLPERQADRTALVLAATLAGLSMLGPFSIDTYMPSFPEIGQTFGVTPQQMQLTLSAYLATFSIMILFHGAISDSFGRRSVILTNLAVFVAGSIGCALAQDFGRRFPRQIFAECGHGGRRAMITTASPDTKRSA